MLGRLECAEANFIVICAYNAPLGYYYKYDPHDRAREYSVEIIIVVDDIKNCRSS